MKVTFVGGPFDGQTEEINPKLGYNLRRRVPFVIAPTKEDLEKISQLSAEAEIADVVNAVQLLPVVDW